MRLLVLLGAVACLALRAPAVDYNRDIQPILAAKCFACHGPDEEKRKAGLRLDGAEGPYAVLPSGATAVVRGNRAASALWQRIHTNDPDAQMPPPSAPKQLTEAERDLLGAWIDAGAPWEEHWSLRPVKRPAAPEVTSSGWVRNPIDRFVLAKLEALGMQPAPEADRRTLIRRLYFDLIGLPPTPEEVESFVADNAPDAYEKLVERLLALPQYGERWARHWLDVARYGETHGYDKDKRRANAWPYRDYVIRAFNEDKPFGTFVREQIAGDVLNPESADGLIATGFLAAGPWDFVGHVELREGTRDKDITRSLDRDDMVSAVMGSFTSMTVHCARCHDHKFDPISQRDYYALQANFAGVDRAEREYDVDPVVYRKRVEWRAEEEEHATQLAALRAQEDAVDIPARRALEAQAEALRARLAAQRESPSNGYHSAIESTADVEKWVQVDLGRPVLIDKIRLVPARPTDFADTPGFGFPVRFRVIAGVKDDLSDATVLHDATARDAPALGDMPFDIAVAGRPVRYIRVVATRLWPRSGDFVFALAELEAMSGPENVAAGAAVIALDSIDSGRWHTRFLTDGFNSRQALRSSPAKDAEALKAELAAVEAKRDALVAESLGEAHRVAKEAATRGLEAVRARLAALPAPARVYAAADDFKPEGNFTPAKVPREIHVLARGDVGQPLEVAAPGALSCIKTLPARFELRDANDEGVRRAALAHWVSDPRNPLTWRSMVNRVWHYHFGRGIVDTPNDFGRLGGTPTHPELLDWLAAELLENGESIKGLHRLICESATYRQASVDHPEYAAKDGNNQYLWRANRRLLDAESARDAMLAVSGKLDLRMGGPGVDLFAFEDDHSPRYRYEDFDPKDPAGFRRSIYRVVVRSVPDPLFDTLDCADPSQSVPARNATITALQALAILNDKFVLQQAEYLAERVAGAGSDAVARCAAAIRLALGREATPQEMAQLGAYADAHGLPAACRLIFNLNEFMFVD